ncbi:hypothetical protein [Acinetobacter baumannii]|uniref:hypothetical protein n=1 Tax=Acinetobacter baumannii TaxID=470 RepID=UPI000DE6D1E9|nr:hypothetical protein [Acinetobacter baumannii]SSQ72069.1 Uncharacterised protein [Acinetobacter baumannii]
MITDIHTWRSEICAQLIRTGKTDIEDVIKDATRLETYVFGSTKTADIKNAEAKTSDPAKTQKAKTEKVEEVKETKTETAPVEEPKDEVVEETTKSEITEKEVKDACLAVAKKDRAALLAILSAVGVSTVATIPADKYAEVIAACESALA